jgi:tape measure domain-containing protein
MAVEVERLIVTLQADLANYNRALAKGQADTNRQLAAIDKRFAATSAKVRQSAISMGAVVGSIGAYLSVDQLVGYANAWVRVTRSIEGSGDVFGITLKSAGELTALANDSRVDLEAYAKLYIRTSAAIRDFGYDSETAATVTTTLAKALKLGAASASEQASVLLQFSQALQKGKLDGDEFRTVMENAGVVQELLAKRLGVTKGKIVEMAAAGKLQLRDLVGAMTDGAEQVNAIFNQMPTTIDEAFAVLNNSITQFIGNLDATYGISQSTAGAIAYLAENIDTVGKAALVAGIGLLAMFAPAIIAGVVALGAGAVATAGGLGALTGILGAGTAAFSLFGDEIGVAEDGLVSLKDVVKATAEELRALTDEEKKLEGFGSGFASAYGESFADRVRRNAKAGALGRGFADSTKVEKTRPEHKIETPVDKETEKARKRFQKDLLEAENRIDVAKQEKEAIGRSAYEVEQMRVRQNLLNEARKAGLTLTASDLAQIEQLADATARAVTEAETLRNAYEDMKTQSQEFLSGFITDMKDGASASEALADALNKIADRLIDMAVQNLVESALGGLTGRGGDAQGSSGGAALMGLFGFANGGIAANGRPVPLKRFAGGGISNTAAIFGEAGPEAAVPLKGGKIPVDLRVPNVPSATPASGGMNLTVSPVFNIENATPGTVDQMKNDIVPTIQKVVRAEVGQMFERKDALRRMKGG